jgi:hypothetical protein
MSLRKGFVRYNNPYIGINSSRQLKIGSKKFRKIFTDRGLDSPTIRAIENDLLLQSGDIRGAYGLVEDRQPFKDSDITAFTGLLQQEAEKKKVMRFVLSDGTEKYLTLRGDNLADFAEALTKNYYESGNVISHGSDAIEEVIRAGIDSMELLETVQTPTDQGAFLEDTEEEISQEAIKELINKAGGFFRYLNTSDIDLTKYQIISCEEEKDILNEHCIIYTLQQCGIREDLINKIKLSINPSSHFAKKNLHKLADIIKKRIVLSFYQKRGWLKKQYYGKNYDSDIHIAIHSDHYFINDDILYREKNYKSIQLIKLLFEGNYFKKDDFIITYTPQYQKCNNKNIPLSNIDEEQEPYEYKPKKIEDNAIFFADTEAETTVGKGHEALMVGVVKMKDNNTITSTRVYVRNEKTNFIYDFLSYIVNNSKGKKAVVYFHNLKYDYHILLPFIYQASAPVMKNNQLYSTTIIFRKKRIEFRDSYKLAPIPLKKFNDTFGLPDDLDKKEAIAYNYYKVNNLKNKSIDINEYITYLKKEEVSIFLNNLETNKRLFEVKDNKFNPIEYYKYYLRYDCLVLCEGMRKYSENINTITQNKLNFFDYLTISSLTNHFMGLMGAFDGLYKVSGNLREFISKAITGGRVQCLERTKKQVINKKIADYDGVSLYPSAISRLCKETGLPLGKCRKINTTDKNILDRYSYYIVDIKINKIGKTQQLPFVSYKDDKGILRYTNDAGEGIYACVDNITLDDWIKFQHIEYEIIDGVYWNEGYNKKMGSVIEKLFNDRLAEKKKGNQALQQVLKLMMNSSYGKTIIKKSMTDKKIINKDDINSFTKNYYHIIKKPIEKLNDNQYLATVDSIDTSFNLAQVGVSILSTSKRIMNEVFDIANDKNYPIYYTDTDSLHCNYDDVEKIEKHFKLKYDRELTGKQLGQFHIDFDLDGAKSEIYATKSIFLGKKCYIDKLESKDCNGKLINGYHYRMKGVTVEGLQFEANKYKGGIFELYENLINNEVEITLNPFGKFMCKYSGSKILTWETGKFTRELKF